jgi:dsRNA-specific ribonuclease
LKTKITEANKANGNIRPLIRILKYWNARNGNPFASFELEKRICDYQYWYWNSNLEDCFYAVVGTLYADYGLSQIKKNAINNLKNKAQLAQQYKQQGFTGYAETTIMTLFE